MKMSYGTIWFLCFTTTVFAGIIENFGEVYDEEGSMESIDDDTQKCLENYDLDDDYLLHEHGDEFLEKLSEERKACRFVCENFVHFNDLMNGGPSGTINLNMVDKTASIQKRTRLLLADLYCRKQ
ncbi:hypothetical protein QAD02_006405, partial [Eretmocerus hayati]